MEENFVLPYVGNYGIPVVELKRTTSWQKKILDTLLKMELLFKRRREKRQAFEKAFSCAIRKNEFLFGRASGKQIFGYEHIEKKIGVPHLSFASGELMEEHLGTKPGSASVMGLINDEDDYVQLIVDKEVAQEECFGCNPGINTSHLKMKTEDLLNKFLPQIRHKAKIMEL